MFFKDLFRRKSIHTMISEANDASKSSGLKKNLSLLDLTSLGIAAIVGAGIFSTIGTASYHGGPAVSLLFVFTAFACLFSAMCYAEFASHVPISGSAYTYSYIVFGELVAWIIGWDLILEYSISNIAVAISWSDYFTSFLSGFGVKIPSYLTMDFVSAYRGYNNVVAQIASGINIDTLSYSLTEAYKTWMSAPQILGIRFIVDVPALCIVVFVTYLVYIGIKESKTATNYLVALKIIIILLVIAVGAFYVNPENWNPFAPNGVRGVMQGLSGVFFAYIGFDAISTTAEECKNPKKDLPRAMFLALIICSVLYVVICLIVTGMVSYKELNVGDPLSYIFHKQGLEWLSGIISLSAVVAMASVLLVYQIGQPRLWMSMSRDGLLSKRFAKIHPKYKTPSYSTIITGIVVCIPVLFMNLTEVTELTSIGTLFAFLLICLGILVIHKKGSLTFTDSNARFKVPYINAKYIMPILFIIGCILIYKFQQNALINLFSSKIAFKHKIPYIVFILLTITITVFSYLKNLSLIPTLGIVINSYLLSELGIKNWICFALWLIVGLVIYFAYSRKKSFLKK